MKYCHQCGKTLVENADFCAHCGVNQLGNADTPKKSEKTHKSKKLTEHSVMKRAGIICLVLILIGSLFSGIYLQYINGDCAVEFDSKGGSSISNQVVKRGQTLDEPEVPTREGFAFAGWYTTDRYKLPFDFSKPITKSQTVYARWVDETDIADSDGDGLADLIEEYYGTDKFLVDTDGDSLSDYLEIILFGYDPLKKDSNHNGIEDGEEDADADTISNRMEIEYGTNPVQVDSDADGLSDADELNVYMTNPVLYDTDKDGANDGWEINQGFDPLGYQDVFSVVVTAENVSEDSGVTASVQMQANGAITSTLKVEEISKNDSHFLTEDIPGYLGSAYSFSTAGEFDSAVITFTYDESQGKVSDTFQPRIYYYNEQTQLLEELDNQIVGDGCVSVTVSHFSVYILLNRVAFDQVWESEIKPPLLNGESADEITLDVMFVIDYSLSMDWNDNCQIFKTLSEEFINKLRDGKDRSGAIKFIKKATLISELTADKEKTISAINDIVYDDGYGAYSGTDGSAGIKMALDELAKSNAEYQFIVFITDGADNGYAYTYDSLIKTANDNGVVIYAIGMGSANESVLKRLSSETGGNYYHATTDISLDHIMNLDDVFADIEASTIDLTMDINNDKIPDYFNALIREGILVVGNGSDQFAGIDFNYDMHGNFSDDYDGDGLKNGEELVIVRSGDTVYLVMKSNPKLEDSDLDGIQDKYDDNPLSFEVLSEKINGKGYQGTEFVITESCVWYNENYYEYIMNWEEPWYNIGRPSTIDERAVSDGTRAISHILLLTPEDARAFATLYCGETAERALYEVYKYFTSVIIDHRVNELNIDQMLDHGADIFCESVLKSYDISTQDFEVKEIVLDTVKSLLYKALKLGFFGEAIDKIVDFEEFAAAFFGGIIHDQKWGEAILENAEQGYGTTILFFYDVNDKAYQCCVRDFGSGDYAWIPNSSTYTFKTPYKHTQKYGNERFSGYLRYGAREIKRCQDQIRSGKYEIEPFAGHYQ